jgi:hypothetical protein
MFLRLVGWGLVWIGSVLIWIWFDLDLVWIEVRDCQTGPVLDHTDLSLANSDPCYSIDGIKLEP